MKGQDQHEDGSSRRSFSRFAFLTHGNGLGPLLPVRRRLGCQPGVGGLPRSQQRCSWRWAHSGAGRISDTTQRRKEALAICLSLEVLICLLTSRVTELWQFFLLTDLQWLVGGCGFTLSPILAGLFAEKEERGRVFGIIAAVPGLAALLGGLSMGRLADAWGFESVFVAIALWYACFVPIALFFVEDKVVAAAPKKQAAGAAPAFGASFNLLVTAAVAGTMAVAMGSLGRSLAMKQQGFSASDISATVAVAGVAMLALSPVLGKLSDRIGRRQMLAMGYVLGCAGLLLFAGASDLRQFMAAMAFVSMITMAGNSAGRALIADLIPAQILGSGLARYGAIGSMGSMCGSAFMGNAVQTVGTQGAFLLSALLPLGALAAVLRIRPPAREGRAAGSPGVSKSAPARADR